MNNPEKAARPEDETVHLNLAAFVPGQKTGSGPVGATSSQAAPAPAAPVAPVDEGVTVMISRAALEVAGAKGGETGGKGDGAPRPAGASGEMLGAVAYAYAKGVYRSEEIARKMASNPDFNAAADGQPPDARALRRFRAKNRGPILEILARFFKLRRKRGAAEVMAQTLPGATPAQPPANPAADPHVQDSPGETTIIARRDAERHLDKAAFIDNMSKED